MEKAVQQDRKLGGLTGPGITFFFSSRRRHMRFKCDWISDVCCSGLGPSVKFQGAVYVAGQFGGWTAIGAEKTASGYEVAWKNGAADQYTVWNLDADGNYIGSATTVVSVADNALQALDTSFLHSVNLTRLTG